LLSRRGSAEDYVEALNRNFRRRTGPEERNSFGKEIKPLGGEKISRGEKDV